MSNLSSRISGNATLLRSVAVTAMLSAAMLATPLLAAHAEGAAHKAASMKGETVEQRISSLHDQLKISPDEEGNWKAVAQTMRDNAEKMEKMAAEQADKAPGSLTAVDDLKTYEHFAHAHFEGLKDLIASFETLYSAMPDGQKKLADHVFQSFGHEGHEGHRG